MNEEGSTRSIRRDDILFSIFSYVQSERIGRYVVVWLVRVVYTCCVGVWCGVVWCHVLWCGMVWCGMV